MVSLLHPADRISKYWLWIPAVLLLAVVVMFQRRRQTKPAF
ncbi:MAG: DUF3394 domain-containing protein [Pseudomonadota bacterium]|nr:DUF3394 domain-containing protein [Pseudomonadota bacterium]